MNSNNLKLSHRGHAKRIHGLKCDWCGKNLPVRRSGKITKGKYRPYKHHFCNRSCEMKFLHSCGYINWEGKNHPNWIKINIKKIKDLYLSGISQKQIAIKLGVCEQTIHRRIKYHKIRRPSLPASEIIQKFKAGMTLTRLRIEYKCGIHKLYKILKGTGLPPGMNKYRKTHQAKSDAKIIEYFNQLPNHKAFHCANLCLLKPPTYPLNICKNCPIRFAEIEKISFFDFILIKNGIFYLGEVKKESDNFSFIQTKNLLALLSQGINICLIEVKENDEIKEIIYFENRKNRNENTDV